MLYPRPSRIVALLVVTITACGQSSIPTTQSTTTAVAVIPTQLVETAAPTDAPTAEPTREPTDEPLPTATEEPASATPTKTANETTITAGASETTTAVASETTTAVANTGVLDAAFSVDSDGNVIPDVLEQELGADPLADDCAARECGQAGQGAEFFLKERNTLLMLDASGSMAASAGGGGNKLDAAKAALNRYVQVVGNVYNLGFLVYGHTGNNTDAGKAESCVGIDVLAPLGQLQPQTFPDVLSQFQPTGWTPIAAALTKAGEAFAGKEGAHNRIILVSDGIETCEGDPVAVARQLHESGLDVVIDVLGYDIADGSADAQQLAQIAEVTGGSYYDAKTAADLDSYFRQQGEAIGQTYDAMVCEVGNFAQTNICDTSLVNKAQARLRQLQSEAASDAERDAYRDLATRINEAYDERQATRREAQARFEELKSQYFDLREQIQQALNDTYVGQ